MMTLQDRLDSAENAGIHCEPGIRKMLDTHDYLFINNKFVPGAPSIRTDCFYGVSSTTLDGVLIARSFASRFLGLMFRKSLGPWNGLLIYPCASIHTFFMRFHIDIVCIGADMKIVDTAENLGPNRVFLPRRRTLAVLELPAGSVRRLNLKTGHRVVPMERLATNHPALVSDN